MIGRQRERAVVAEALSSSTTSARVLVLFGEAGVGKTLLMDHAAEEAAAAGTRVLRVAGNTAEAELAFAGLHQLLLPVLGSGLDGLPVRQRTALLAAFGLGEDPAPPDPMMMSLAVLTLASQIASAGRLLLVVDDAQWLDHGSRQVLGFVARRLAGESIGLLVAVRGSRLPEWLDATVPHLEVGPLSPAEAEELLGAQPEPPVGGFRRHVLATAAGNPLALVELARSQPRDEALPPAGPVPLTDLLERTFAAQADGLPPATRAALLVAAAAEGAALPDVLAALPPGTDMDVWLPAERTGLVRLRADRIDFRHPLVRSAVYGAAPFAERRRAHLALAAVLDADPDRRAWQLSAATVTPEASVAGALEATAMRTFGRGAFADALTGLERAAQLHPERGERTRLLSTAAYTAVLVGDLTRAESLAAQARQLVPDETASGWISALGGLVAMLMMRMERAFALVVPAGLPADGQLAVDVSTIATGIVYHSGIPAQRERIRPMLAARTALADDMFARPLQLWDLGVTDPFGHGDAIRAELPALASAPGLLPTVTHTLGVLAMVLDETETAVSLLGELVNPQWEDAADFHAGMTAADLAWAHLDCGRWADARLGVERLAARFLAGQHHLGPARALSALATVCALTGDPETALRHITAALAATEPARALATTVRARRAAALAATALGDHPTARLHLRALFDACGAPVHYHLSCYAVADHAAAAVLTGHTEDARTVLERVREEVGDGASPRLRQILLRAAALLAGPDDGAGDCFREALADPAGQRWPFERAQVWLEYGEWLRRRRQIAEARSALAEARDLFAGLGAPHWSARAEAELRAAGVAVGPDRHSALHALTPQRQRIVRLAAQGLTNREIGERLFLSPRTVGTHLYQAFPALGVTSRSQLRDVVEQEG
ncbi:transcriptional regulator [Streptomyces spiroverticillatus]|uniref:Transcriptional regulator n=1 Tax=Streptomyces finlayi TaxID=67296 RepID=A0A918X0C6_9ACTN|nr:LuxR family transcriptional regulator [Streptomyces finlayi]GHA18366.1 transcriptional regulator [Streptomyces spiroverticillatus]GHC99968.1 transcriptional regulator [Streptomyces finlayi]